MEVVVEATDVEDEGVDTVVELEDGDVDGADVVVVEAAPSVHAHSSRLTPHRRATRRIGTSSHIVSPGAPGRLGQSDRS
ncbi:MAG: hypothetical protein OEM84_11495 [Acidimicrobiia bacterium]|nr:hypothetical protein [Acidimicrobiia bacterium]